MVDGHNSGDAAEKVASSGSSTVAGDRVLTSRITFKDEEAGNAARENFSSKFTLSPDVLHNIVASKDLEKLRELGGLAGLEAALRTNLKSGINLDEDELPVLSNARPDPGRRRQSLVHLHLDTAPKKGFSDRRHAYSDNRLPPRKSKSFLRLIFDAFNDKLMFLLTFSAVISLSLGIYQSVDPSEPGSNVEWVEGVTIVIAIIIILMATATNDWQKNRKFEKLNRKKDEKFVNLVRSGKIQHISSNDILVGDLVRLETGDVVPVDGILIEGFDIEADESSTTGESDLIEKSPFIDSHSAEAALRPSKIDPFILSGSKVANGVGTFVATSVGVNSSYGRILMSLRDEPQETPLQQKLGSLAKYILLFGALFGVVFFFILLTRFLVRLDSIEGGPRGKGEEFLELFMLSVTMVVIGVPEGLALAVTLALAFATTRMLKDNNLVRLLRSCEIMGNATTICSDKTGTLTQNKMTVVTCKLGLSDEYEDGELFGTADVDDQQQSDSEATQPIQSLSLLPTNVVELLRASIILNTTAVDKDNEYGKMDLQGSSTEKALVQFTIDRLYLEDLTSARQAVQTVHLFPFQSTQKSMACVVELPGGGYRMYAKGAAEIVLSRCTSVLEDPKTAITSAPLGESEISRAHEHISRLAHRSLRVLGIAYRDFESWPPSHDDATPAGTEHLKLDDIFRDMTLLSIVGLRDPLRPDVIESVRQCQKAGVFVRMVTGDNFATAKAISRDCGIFTAGGIAMDGPTFRKLSPSQLDKVVPRLQVLARSSPEDKRVLVYRLRALREIVAVTGDGTNDALALKAADVGFAMGIAGTEVAKEASSIILMDDNFTSIVKAVQWGRTVNDAVKKFLQFQLTINFSAGLLTAITALVGEVDDAVFSVVQLLWVNIIMDTFAALSLATDYPTRGVLQRKPEPRGQPIITVNMWKMVIAQTLYQMAVIFVLHYAGSSIWTADTEHQQDRIQTTAFNTYIFMQLFNQWNCRTPDERLNIFEGMHRNPWFFFVQAVTITGQTLIVFFGGNAFQTARPSGAQWATSIVLGLLTLPLGTLVRIFPNSWFLLAMTPIRKLFHLRMRRRAVKREKKAQAPAKPGFLRRTMSVIKREAVPPKGGLIPTNEDTIPPTEEELKLHRTASRTSLQRQREGEGMGVDLGRLIGAARKGERLDEKLVFEVHENTAPDDPLVLVNMERIRELNVPPSQDPDHLMYLNP
jgi:P-type Ca2+ transporter type 2C